MVFADRIDGDARLAALATLGRRWVDGSLTPEGLAAVIYGGAPLDSIDVEGDMALAKRFVTLFPLPEKAETAFNASY